VGAFEPTFRHAEMNKNEVWAQLLALAHNVLVDLRAKVDGGEALKPRPSPKPIRSQYVSRIEDTERGEGG